VTGARRPEHYHELHHLLRLGRRSNGTGGTTLPTARSPLAGATACCRSTLTMQPN
jgi:hypothetical protein